MENHPSALEIKTAHKGLPSNYFNHFIMEIKISRLFVRLILLSTVLFITLCTFNRKEKSSVNNGVEDPKINTIIKEIGLLDNNGKRTGKWIGYFKNNIIGYLGYYLNGLKDSTWDFYNHLGIMEKREHYSKGLKQGVTSIYSEGILYDEVEFKNDKKMDDIRTIIAKTK